MSTFVTLCGLQIILSDHSEPAPPRPPHPAPAPVLPGRGQTSVEGGRGVGQGVVVIWGHTTLYLDTLRSPRCHHEK